MSNAVMAPRIVASGTLPTSPRPESQAVKDCMINAIGVPIPQTIMPPVIKVPTSG